jgi:hypothetical protein
VIERESSPRAARRAGRFASIGLSLALATALAGCSSKALLRDDPPPAVQARPSDAPAPAVQPPFGRPRAKLNPGDASRRSEHDAADPKPVESMAKPAEPAPAPSETDPKAAKR